ncbi:glycosyltransferase involved in cell wall biosynthesis [Salegentibacter sp. 24]|uniref:glycosyltransferase family 4 protein n=1 Tax=Salegentibacter sp. 24 TaxID=2183986 RepID=UPI00105E365B|nr:glycosyltransferase family 4 protein [Salegentibacter sp. 24]TDN82166.1 glycosyltransferase involved in cell wall biosynthesis [Salegentibacter sp. 24]
MRLLYYSTSFYANHGGSIQSKEFFKQLDNMAVIEEKTIFPLKVKREFSSGNSENSGIKNKLKAIPLLQVVFFYRRSSFYMKALKEKILQFKPDVLFMQIDSNFLQIHQLKKEFPELKICTQVNGSPFDEPFRNIAFKNKFRKLQRKAYQQADLNIFISEFSRKAIMGDYLDQTRDFVIHNGTDTDKFFPLNNKRSLRKTLNYPLDSFIIGYIGTLDHHKKLEILIEAFFDLHKEFSYLALVIIGDGPAMAKLKDKVKKLRLEGKVIFRGWTRHENININLNCFDLAVHHYANTYMNPLKIFEYLSVGLPVIAPRIPSVEKMFLDGEDLLLTSQDKTELKSHLFRLITDPDLRSKLSYKQHLITSLESNFTWKKYTERIVTAMGNLK